MTSSKGINLIFRNINYSVQTSQQSHRDGAASSSERRVILNNISGVFCKGKVSIVMGTSGAGKTTLLHILSGQVTGKSRECLDGEIYVNSQKVQSSTELSKLSAFVHQEDCLDPWMTVQEALTFSARLRQADSSLDVKSKVEEMMDLLEINHIRDSLIGVSSGSTGKRGISGGERKRVAIAMELMTDPSVLFLDEPTTGLDTFIAWRVFEILHKLSRTAGYTIVIIVHQPPSCVFPFFDTLLLLGADGCHGAQPIYQGPASEALKYFSKLGHHCPRLENPTDFIFIKVLSAGRSKCLDSEENAHKITWLIDEWKNSEECALFDKTIDSAQQTTQLTSFATCVKHSGPHVQYWVILVRTLRSFWRSKEDLITYMLFYPIFDGILIGLTYLNLGRYSAALQLNLRTAAIFFIINSQFGSGKGHWVSCVADEHKIFNREYSQKYYELVPFVLAKLTFELMLGVITSSIIVLISYYMIGLAPAFSSALFLIFLCVMGYFGGIGFGYILLGFGPRNAMVAIVTKRVSSSPLSIAGGLFAVSIPSFMIWLKFISPVYYSFSAALQNQLGALPCSDIGDEECALLKAQDLFAILQFDATLSPGVCIALGMTVAIAFFSTGFLLQRIRYS